MKAKKSENVVKNRFSPFSATDELRLERKKTPIVRIRPVKIVRDRIYYAKCTSFDDPAGPEERIL